ncbi:hypothetical protein E2C01_020295 [Portunus trituberculatus]|uniref:Uncharacterized protein n=1 Tax=Portunus trituberculatus TaxID=210409 RepID=A0A5B7E1L7_PORTR|nr:hypothetical protein [Portunus trituberculatus]
MHEEFSTMLHRRQRSIVMLPGDAHPLIFGNSRSKGEQECLSCPKGSEAIQGWGIGDGWVVEGDEGDDSLTHSHSTWGQGMRHFVVGINEGSNTDHQSPSPGNGDDTAPSTDSPVLDFLYSSLSHESFVWPEEKT